MIYFLGNEEQDVVKVGYTNNWKKRKASLQTACPFKLELLLQIEGSIEREKYLHGVFEDQRLRGEWFRIQGVVDAFIKSKGETIIGEMVGFTVSDMQNNVLYEYYIMKITKEYIDLHMEEKYHSPDNFKKAILHVRKVEKQFKEEFANII